jgi:ubiquinone/menaquinone biosynthesis C-methylase UbiE
MKEIYEQIRNFWDRKPCGTTHVALPLGSPEYFIEFDRYYGSMYPYLLPFLDLESMRGKWILEIGLGSGFTLSNLSKVAGVCVGLDISRETLRLNQARNRHFKMWMRLVEASATDIPMADNTFDLVISIGCLHHIPDIDRAVAEIHRVLKPGGIFKGMVYNRNSYRFRLYIPMVRRLSRNWREKDWRSCVNEMYDGSENPYGMVYSRKEIRALFNQFEDIRFRLENFVGQELLPRIGGYIPPTFLAGHIGQGGRSGSILCCQSGQIGKSHREPAGNSRSSSFWGSEPSLYGSHSLPLRYKRIF